MTPRDELTPETLRCAWVPLREYCEETLRDHASAWAADRKRIEELEMTLAFYGRCGHLGFDGGARARAALRGEEETP